MVNFLKRCWVEVELDNLEYNYNLIKSSIKKTTDVMAIVKANAYGHGSVAISLYLQNIGVKFFGVSNLYEAVELRDAGIKGDILILGYTPIDSIDLVYKYDIIQTVYNIDYVSKIDKIAQANNFRIRAHLKVDTGMGRLGFLYTEFEKDLKNILLVYKMKNINIEGIFSHFSSADMLDFESVEHTKSQISNFDDLIFVLKSKGIDVGVLHIQNSMGIVNFKDLNYDLVRPGIILYGINPCVKDTTDLNFKPLMTLKSVVSMVKNIKKGSYISYGDFKADKDMKIATISCGYGDGYPRSSTSKRYVIINGKKAEILGTICMDQMVVDVSYIDKVEVFDEVVLFDENSISILEMTFENNLFSYEILCNMNNRALKVYKKHGKILELKNPH